MPKKETHDHGDVVNAGRRGGWPGPRKIQKVVPQHPEQVATVQAYAEREGITYAAAMRDLVDIGLEAVQVGRFSDIDLSVALDEWHRQCHMGATQVDAMRAVLAAVTAGRPNEERQR